MYSRLLQKEGIVIEEPEDAYKELYYRLLREPRIIPEDALYAHLQYANRTFLLEPNVDAQQFLELLSKLCTTKYLDDKEYEEDLQKASLMVTHVNKKYVIEVLKKATKLIEGKDLEGIIDNRSDFSALEVSPKNANTSWEICQISQDSREWPWKSDGSQFH